MFSISTHPKVTVFKLNEFREYFLVNSFKCSDYCKYFARQYLSHPTKCHNVPTEKLVFDKNNLSRLCSYYLNLFFNVILKRLNVSLTKSDNTPGNVFLKLLMNSK